MSVPFFPALYDDVHPTGMAGIQKRAENQEKSGSNLDRQVVEGFGDEWTRFDQRQVGEPELRLAFEEYFAVFPWSLLSPDAVGFDLGCGTGRWARFVAPRVKRLLCIDASEKALEVARQNLADVPNCECHLAGVDELPLPDASADFGYSLGVLHHVPDTAAAIRSCVRKLAPGAPFLLYLYYRFDNRPRWYAWIWSLSDVVRRAVSRLPSGARFLASQLIAAVVYWPLARFGRLAGALGAPAHRLPLSYYSRRSFYAMRTDALDRFGTRLEQRFTRAEIEAMMKTAGLRDIVFSDHAPFWCVVGFRA